VERTRLYHPTMNSAHLEVCASPEWRQIVEENILPEALRGMDLGSDVIEIGPGPGFTTDVLMKIAARLTAVEVDTELAGSLRARMVGTNVNVVCGDAASLDFASDTFSGAASFHMLHHIETNETQDKVFSELARVLEPGGVLVAADGIENESSRSFHEGDIYNPIDPDDLRVRLTTAGFTSLDIRVHDLGWMCSAVLV
jgi:SAM-dependent methyltransferase